MNGQMIDLVILQGHFCAKTSMKPSKPGIYLFTWPYIIVFVKNIREHFR